MSKNYSHLHYCLVCGYELLAPLIDCFHDICACCGSQIYYDYHPEQVDESMIKHIKEYRRNWIDKGMPFSGAPFVKKPADFNLNKQLSNLPKELR